MNTPEARKALEEYQKISEAILLSPRNAMYIKRSLDRSGLVADIADRGLVIRIGRRLV